MSVHHADLVSHRPPCPGREVLAVLIFIWFASLLEMMNDRPIHHATRQGRLDGLVDQLRQGVDIDLRGQYGFTALHYAAIKGHVDMVSVLLKRRA